MPKQCGGKISEVELRSKTLESTSKLQDRRKKCVSEHYSKEKKVSQSKQFSYNKLKNEQVLSPSMKQKPLRPPQPSNSVEGVLIDLSPEDILIQQNNIGLVPIQQRKTGSCILDEPIDIPTENEEIEAKLVPPPYQMPPTYSNTLEFSRNNNSPRSSPKYQAVPRPQSHQPLKLDPFDTSHISSISRNSSRRTLNYDSGFNDNSMDLLNSSKHFNILASELNHWPNSTELEVSETEISLTSGEESLSDSMNVNLSQLTLEDSFNNKSTPKKLDKAFLAELEKDIYKNEASAVSLNVNNSHSTYAMQGQNKENSVSSIYDKTMPDKMFNTLSPQRPAKTSNCMQKSVNRPNYDFNNLYSNTSSKNYTSTSNIQQEKPNNLQTSNYADTNTLVNQIWMETAVNSPSNIYGNIPKSHNFVAVSNRPVSTVIPDDIRNFYNSVPGDIYSSVIYEPISQISLNNSSASIYGTLPRNDNGIYNNINQSAIYDEVAGEELLRPIRPAPALPGVQLSAQQIQRRIEKQQLYGNVSVSSLSSAVSGNMLNLSESQKITALMVELEDAVEDEARAALQAVNWDHNLAIRHFKVERLFR